ncbi:MAG: TonB-dependent receptor [Bradyrhizobium sp.]|nr:TonB-dependent receptor [Bradyrhizobium sp.]
MRHARPRRRSKLWPLLHGGAAVLAYGAFLPSSALAQTAPAAAPAGQDDATRPEIIVTATRLARADVPTPMLTIDSKQLSEASRPNFVAALNDLPQFKAGWSPQITGGSFAGGSYSIDLRGLGSARSLVLLDGRRLVSNYTNGLAGPDLAVIPAILVDRVDVVTGSASATWGSNAVAGVVNVIINDRLEGFRVGGRAGISDRGDVGERQLEAAAGLSFAGGKGHFLIGGEYVDNDGGKPKTSRPNVGRWAVLPNPAYTATNGQQPYIFASNVGWANASPGGLILTGVNANRAFNPDGTLRAFNLGTVLGTTSIGGEGPSFDDYTYFSAPSTRYSAMARVSYEFSDALKWSADVLFSRTFANSSFLPDATRGSITIQSDNAFLSPAIRNQMLAAGQTSFVMGRVNADFALLENDYRRRSIQATTSLEGKFGGSWQWNAYYSHAQYNEDNDLKNQRLTANFALAVDAVADPVTGAPICRIKLTTPSTNCVPINLFGEGNTSQAARNYVLGTGIYRLRATLDNGGVTLRGEPFSTWAGPVSIAVGGEARHEAVRQDAGALDLAKAFTFNNFTALSGSNTTEEAFGEVLIPLLNDVPGFRSLKFNGATRITNDRTGSIWSWKLGLIDQVAPGLELRGTYSRDIRSPNLLELFSGQVLTIANIIQQDPNNHNMAIARQINTFAGGNPNLRPETSKTTTAGLTLSPQFIPNLTISVDYFDIAIANAIGTISPQQIVTLCEQGNQSLCGSIIRDAGGLITQISASQLNFTKLSTRGLDVSASYRIPISGTARIALRTNLTSTWKYRTDNGLSVANYLGSQGTIGSQGVPKLVVNSAISYEDDTAQFTLRNRFLSAGVNNGTLGIQNNRIPAYAYFDLAARVTVRAAGSTQFQLFANVNNLFDKAPPISSAFSPYYDIIVRYFVVGASVRF